MLPVNITVTPNFPASYPGWPQPRSNLSLLFPNVVPKAPDHYSCRLVKQKGTCSSHRKIIKIRSFTTESRVNCIFLPNLLCITSTISYNNPCRPLQKFPFSSPRLVWHLFYIASSQLPSSAFPYTLVQEALRLPPKAPLKSTQLLPMK